MRRTLLLNLVLASGFFFMPIVSQAMECGGITKEVLCVSYPECSWEDGYCVNNDSSHNVANHQLTSLQVLTDGWEYLGCATDDQQCDERAQLFHYSLHRSETSLFCPNASKLACYGRK